MKTLKQYGKTIAVFGGFLILLAMLLSLFQTFNILYSKSTDILIMIGMILSLFIIGFSYGKKAEKKGFLEGLKIGVCLIILLIFINLIFYQTGFSLERFLYYTVLILSSTFGSMIGINKKH